MPALVVAIEGPDFSGKTTISNLIIEILREKNKDKKIEFKKTALPSELITGSLTKILRSSKEEVSPSVFALVQAADHLHHYETIINALRDSQNSNLVIQERSLLSFYVYQGVIPDLDFTWLNEINKNNKNYPDLTLILKVDVDELLSRKEGEKKGFDKFEQEKVVRKQFDIYYNLDINLRKKFNVEYIESNDTPINVAILCADRIQKEIDKLIQ